jgi:hypothetical protein
VIAALWCLAAMAGDVLLYGDDRARAEAVATRDGRMALESLTPLPLGVLEVTVRGAVDVRMCETTWPSTELDRRVERARNRVDEGGSATSDRALAFDALRGALDVLGCVDDPVSSARAAEALELASYVASAWKGDPGEAIALLLRARRFDAEAAPRFQTDPEVLDAVAARMGSEAKSLLLLPPGGPGALVWVDGHRVSGRVVPLAPGPHVLQLLGEGMTDLELVAPDDARILALITPETDLSRLDPDDDPVDRAWAFALAERFRPPEATAGWLAVDQRLWRMVWDEPRMEAWPRRPSTAVRVTAWTLGALGAASGAALTASGAVGLERWLRCQRAPAGGADSERCDPVTTDAGLLDPGLLHPRLRTSTAATATGGALTALSLAGMVAVGVSMERQLPVRVLPVPGGAALISALPMPGRRRAP